MSKSGQILSSSRGYKFYLPNPLPPEINWSLGLINALSDADRLLGNLAGEGSKLPNPHILIRPFIAREAVLSSRIEGTHATLGEILAADAGAVVEAKAADDLKEVNNYIIALDYGIKRLETLPLSLRLIRELHQKLMTGVRGEHAAPGEFRYTQNWIGVAGCTIATATYVPPAPDYLMACLGDLENFLRDHTLPPLVQVALAHYQFEAIHPFLDGNGRVGRLLITLFLIERNVLPAPLLYLSAFFEATRLEYYARLLAISQHDDWNGWLQYFLNGVARQAEDAVSRSYRINQLLTLWRQQTADLSVGLSNRLINELGKNPFITVNKSAELFSVSYTTMQRAINKLVELGIVQEVSGNKRNKIYCAKLILKILEEPAKITAG